jgi:hypothetical protein
LGSKELIGDFNLPEDEGVQPHLQLTVPVKDFSLDWRRYNLISNYLAEYSAYQFEHKDKAENLISSLFYELIEHMVSASQMDASLHIKFFIVEGWMLFELSSSFPDEELNNITEILNELLSTNIDSYYSNLLEGDLDKPENKRILGLAMLVHDYNTRLSASKEADTGAVILRARVRQEEIDA